jgi:hypothetical protein
MIEQLDQLEALASILTKEVSSKPQADQIEWYGQVSSKKNIVKYLMRLVSVEQISTPQFKLGILCIDSITDMIVSWKDPGSISQLVDQFVSVENFWTSVHTAATSVDSGASTRCHCFRLMLNAYNSSNSAIPNRIFSDETISSILNVLSDHQSSSISRNRQNLQSATKFLLLVFDKHPARFQKHLLLNPSARTPLVEVCSQFIVAADAPSRENEAIKRLAESLVENSNDVYTPLALMIF